MTSSDLASEERLREMRMFEEETFKSLGVRIDGDLALAPLSRFTEHRGDVKSASKSAIPQPIDLDSIVDLDADAQVESVTNSHGEVVFLNGDQQAESVSEPAIITSDTANFPLYAESPGLIAGPTSLGQSAATDNTSMRPSPNDILDEAHTQPDQSMSVPEGTQTHPNRSPGLSGGKASGVDAMKDDSPAQLEANIRAMYEEYCVDDGDGEGVSQQQIPLSWAEEEFQRRTIVWKGGVSDINF